MPTPMPILLTILLAGPAEAETVAPPVGTKVVTRYAQPLRVADRVVDAGSTARIYTVQEIQGDRVWIEVGRIGGWVGAGDVVPYDRAIDFYTREIRTRGIGEAYNWRGSLWLQRGEYAKALADYDAAARLDPGNAWAHQNRGLALTRLGRRDAALTAYDEAIRLDPGHVTAHLGRGNLRLLRNELAAALADYDEAIRLDPTNASAHASRGHVRFYQHDYPAALADCDEAIRLDPATAVHFSYRAAIRIQLERYDGARADADAAIRLDPTDALAYASRGEAWYFQEQAARSLPDYDRAIGLDPTSARTRNCRGDAHKCLHAYDRALADYDEAIRLDPLGRYQQNARAWLLATCADPRYRDGPRAVEAATKACEIAGGRDAETTDTLAAAYAELGDFDRARSHARRAVDLATDPRSRREFQARLDLYDRQQPYRAVECTHP